MLVRRLIIALAVAAIVCWRFPLFHVVSLKTAAAEKAAGTFNPQDFAAAFWTNHLLPSATKAVDAKTLLAAIETSAPTAKTNYSRSVGMADGYFYFLSGTGHVIAVSDDEISLTITTDAGTNAEISLQTGLIFGNALRDGTGLLNVSDYPNSQDFNAISEALNHIVETQVLPKLRTQAKVGEKLFFAGCVEVDDESSDLKPLKIIPIQTEAK